MHTQIACPTSIPSVFEKNFANFYLWFATQTEQSIQIYFLAKFYYIFSAKFYIVIKLFERMAKVLSKRGNSLLIVAAVSL